MRILLRYNLPRSFSNPFVMIFPRMSFLCKVVPVQYREYEMVYLMKPRSMIVNDVGRHKCQDFFFTAAVT